jgi:hypothetical protein
MNSNLVTAIGLVFAGLGVAAAAGFGALSSVIGTRQLTAGRLGVAENRTARREAFLYDELARLERLAGLLKRMWASVNRLSVGREPATSSSPDLTEIAGQEMDALLYDVRAVLMMFGRDEMPRCTHLVESFGGRRLLANGGAIQEAESELVDAITRCRTGLRELAPRDERPASR